MIRVKGKDLIVEHEIVLSEQQYKKISSKELQPRIENIERDMMVKHRVERRKNAYISIMHVNSQFHEIDKNYFHELEMHHIAFLSEIDKMQMPCSSNKRKQLIDIIPEKEIKFFKHINNVNNIRKVKLVVFTPDGGYKGYIPPDALKRMLTAYLDKYETH